MKNKKKILFICIYFWPENFRSTNTAELLSKNNYEITVLTSFPTYPDKSLFKNLNTKNLEAMNKFNFKIIRVPIFYRKQNNYISIFLNYISFIFSGIIIGTYKLKGLNFNIIFCFAPSPIFQSWVAIWFKYIKKSKSITWIQDIWPETLEAVGVIKNKQLLSIINFFVNLTYKLNDKLITQSKTYYEKINGYYNKVYYVPNVSENNTTKIIKHNLFLFKKEKFYITYTGNIGIAQNLDILLDAAIELKNNLNIQFILIGSGTQFQQIAKKIKNKKITNIFLLFAIDYSLIPHVLSKSNVL